MSMSQREVLEASDSLRQWFDRGGTDPKTGKKFKGWVNCKTGGPCGRKSKKSGGSYPACRPTKAACKSIKGKMYKKKGPKRVNWKKKKKKSENAEDVHKPVKPGILKKRLGKLSCSKVRGAKGKLKDKGTHYAKALQRYLNYHC
jgi:hypothetical protein